MKKLREYHEVLIGGSRYIELKGRKISLEELSTYPWISLTSEALTRKFLNNYFADHGLQFLPDMELATTDLITILELDLSRKNLPKKRRRQKMYLKSKWKRSFRPEILF